MRMGSRTGLNTEIPAFLNKIQSKQGKDIDTIYIFLYTEEDHIPLTPGRSSVEQGFSGGGKKQQDAADGHHKPTTDPVSILAAPSPKQ